MSLIGLACEVSRVFLNRKIYSTYTLFSCLTIFYTVPYKIAEEIYISYVAQVYAKENFNTTQKEESKYERVKEMSLLINVQLQRSSFGNCW